MSTNRIREEARETEVGGEYDVLVAGGGPAGLAASIAAAREGARTLLVERYGFLGGTGTAGLVGSFCGFYTTGREKKQIIGGIGATMLDRLARRRAVTPKSVSRVDPRIASMRFNPEGYKVVAEEFAAESGVELLFHTSVVDVVKGQKAGTLSGVMVESKSGRGALLARVIVDATGDGDVAACAGAPFEYGDGRGGAQALTTMFRLSNVDQEQLKGLTLAKVKEILGEANKDGRYGFNRVDGILSPALPDGISVNISSVADLSALDARDLTRAEIEGRRQAYEYVRAFREHLPGFERAELSSFAPQVGIRETRRVTGRYMMTEADVVKGRKFDDAVALGAWPVELHDPVTRGVKWTFLETEDDYYSIPLRCLIPEDAENLLVAGRCISATHVAQASTRVIGPAFAMGEAAGILAARTALSGSAMTSLPVETIQNRLRKYGALLAV